MNTPIEPLQFLQQFRHKLYGAYTRRADALFELMEALLLATDRRSPVALSQSPAFRRRFSMVYDALQHGELSDEQGRALLCEAEPAEALTLGGYGIYVSDSTPQPRRDAPTLPDRGQVYSTQHDGPVVGQQHSWLGRVVAQGQSWFAPRDVERIPTDSTPTALAATQVLRLVAALAVGALAVVVADSAYAHVAFLTVFVGLSNACVLVRLANNRVLYGAPPPSPLHPQTGKRLKRGRPAGHGPKFRLKDPPPPERSLSLTVKNTTIRLSAWRQLHFNAVPQLAGLVLRAEFLKADGSPKYRRPLWLFWSGPDTVNLEHLCQMYLVRYVVEHFFRFNKQRLGLHCAYSTDPTVQRHWLWTVVFAYVQLMLARNVITAQPHPWDPAPRRKAASGLTPGQVRDAWAVFSRELEQLTAAPRPSGKGTGREAGFCPAPRPRYPVVSKTPKTGNV